MNAYISQAGPQGAEDDPALDQLWQTLLHKHPDPAHHLGEALVERGLIDRAQLARAMALQAQAPVRKSLNAVILEQGLLRQDQIDAVMTQWLEPRYVDVGSLHPQPEALRLVPAAFALRELVLPLMVRGGSLVVALADPWDARGLAKELRLLTGLPVLTVAAKAAVLQHAIVAAYRPRAGQQVAERSLHELVEELTIHDEAYAVANVATPAEADSTLVQFINRLIAQAVAARASDIHIESAEAPELLKVRLRVDGELRDELELPARYGLAIVSRLKIMADLDIAEHRKPQDGKIDFARFGGERVELRIVTVPTVHGLEDVVLRLLGGMRPRALDTIDLAAVHLQGLREVIHRPYGLLLICGPTGSGKTTTLHSVLRELNDGRRKIWTAEDPVEITQKGLRQVQVNPRIGWTFAAAMRTFLRADPDVIMIGEMRDEETARIAVEASLTGHLVMSTLHTNSAAESIGRLLEIGLDPFTFSDSLLGVLAQRLVRRLCDACRLREPLANAELAHLTQLWCESGGRMNDAPSCLERWRAVYADADGRMWRYRRQGCPKCEGTGYRGRLGVHELLVADEALRGCIRRRAPMRDIQALGQASGMLTLRQDGIEKVLQGLTDLSEVMAATGV